MVKFMLVTVTALEQMILCFVIPLVVYAAVMWEWAGGSVSSARMATLISAKMDVKLVCVMIWGRLLQCAMLKLASVIAEQGLEQGPAVSACRHSLT
jgi:hypothetical protein